MLGTCAAALLACLSPARAQEQAPPQEADAADEGVVEFLEPDEIDALVAPVVLYPDPLLALVLQASISPLDIVEAERFLLRREKDPSLEPDPDWDSSVVGLLNYPELIGSMSEYLDWTQLLGGAVVDQIDSVQASIQDIRNAALAQGILESNPQQKVVVVDDLVVIAPVDKSTISVPQYDPVQLLAALTPADEVIEEEPEVTVSLTGTPPVEVAPEPPASRPEPPPVAAAAPAPEPPPPPPAAAAPAPAPAPAPTYYAEPTPTYAAPPPPISYAAPQSTFWSSAATFAGGAAIGGLLGYAWGDDDDNDNDNDNDGWDDVEDAIRDLDDDDWDDFVDRIDEDDFEDFVDRFDEDDWDEARDRWNDRDGGKEINISDSTIVVGNQVKRDQLNAKLKNKRDSQLNVARGGDRTKLDLKNGTLKREGGVNVANRGDRAGAPDKMKRPQGLAPAKATRDRPGQRPGVANQAAGGQNRPKVKDVKLPGGGTGNLAAAGQNRQRANQQLAQAGGQRPAAGQGQRPRPQQASGGAQRRDKAVASARRPGAQPQAAVNRGVTAGLEQPREVRKAANRGASSKAKAGLQKPKRPQATQAAKARPQPQAANRGGKRPMGGVKSGQNAKRDSKRGKQSLAKAGGGGKGGNRRGRG
jgi:hypothetical protein